MFFKCAPVNVLEIRWDGIQVLANVLLFFGNQAGVLDGGSLIFESGKRLCGGQLAVRYEVVSGNNTLAQGGGGVRVAKGELVFDSRLPLSQLKSEIIKVCHRSSRCC